MKPKHWLVFITLGVIWSSSFLWIKIGVQDIGPMALTAFRMLFGALTAVAIGIYQKVEWPRDLRTWIIFGILGPASLAIPVFLISWGEQTIDSAVASILNATVPLFTVFIAHFVLQDDKMTMQKVLGLLIGFAGTILLLSEDLTVGAKSSVIGQAAVILASIFYAGSAVYGRKYTQHVEGTTRGAMFLITSAIFMWIVGPLAEKPFEFPSLPITWIAILWLGILGSGLAVIMLWYLIHEIGPTRTSLVTYLFPVGGLILGVIFLNEHLSWQLLAGSVLIIFSLVVVNWKSAKQAQPAK
ncbi:MAG TPA: DMT family transporter [Anaerolineales bacterium]|nr:DMT family transporter [Anaerolineales bacterium]HMR99439.1 DMT family transporter [Anaerolineales bacterium]HNQ94279.1 DMT family transporter [Anaerolineales bacterium]HNS62512.1 DMT family transporter [Anaerolineales bacterium]